MCLVAACSQGAGGFLTRAALGVPRRQATFLKISVFLPYTGQPAPLATSPPPPLRRTIWFVVFCCCILSVELSEQSGFFASSSARVETRACVVPPTGPPCVLVHKLPPFR